MSSVLRIPTKPIEGQKPGTSGLRKKTPVFMQPHYLENFVQAIWNGTGGAKGSTKNINPDTAKTVTVKAKVTGRKGSKKTLTFTAKSGKSTAKAKIKVTVK